MIPIADTSFVVALLNDHDFYHEACLKVYRQQSKIYITQSALTEIFYMIRREKGGIAGVQFLLGLPRSKYEIVPLIAGDIERAGRIIEKYANVNLDFVDATVVALAERMDINQILTLDRRDFQIIRPTHTDYFEILP